ncbi:peroxisomal membrane protein 2 [Quercus suber]|uniref:Peroxisomal membrane protein 2 n=1 Tax=Quercus suber TaxID=58331 RepID=A0AAW0J5N5_QUESU
MASVPSISPQSLLPLSKLKPRSKPISKFSQTTPLFSRNKQKTKKSSLVVIVKSMVEELDVIPVQSADSTDQQEGVVVSRVASEGTGLETELVSGFGASHEGRLSFEGAGFSSSGSVGDGVGKRENEEIERLIDRTINATIVLAAGTFAITKLLTIDQDYWHGWTIYEIVRYAPQHNWTAYEEALKRNPVLAKMVISGVVYSVGDWIAQCFEGKPLFEFDRIRMFRSGLVGFTLHGSLSHYYYQFCEELFPFQDWWVVPVKAAYAVIQIKELLLLSSYELIYAYVKSSSIKPCCSLNMQAGWKLWPFAHLITYGVIPVEQRLLWVDCVELIWVTILSTNEQNVNNQKLDIKEEEFTLNCEVERVNQLSDGL